ncbi:MAG: hypothetical protein AB7F29_17485 [Candidatus Nitrosocosmicus sp.]
MANLNVPRLAYGFVCYSTTKEEMQNVFVVNYQSIITDNSVTISF